MNLPHNPTGPDPQPMDEVSTMLAGLKSKKKSQDHKTLLKYLPGVRAALARDVAWETIVEGLASKDIKTSIKRLKDLIAKEDARPAAGTSPAPHDTDTDPGAPESFGNAAGPDAERNPDRSSDDALASETVQDAEGGAS